MSQAHLVAQAALHLAQEDRHDLRDVLLLERMEHDHVVQPVEELGVEDLVDLVLDLLLHLVERGLGVRAVEPQRLALT